MKCIILETSQKMNYLIDLECGSRNDVNIQVRDGERPRVAIGHKQLSEITSKKFCCTLNGYW